MHFACSRCAHRHEEDERRLAFIDEHEKSS
jgi:hypothetical protein